MVLVGIAGGSARLGLMRINQDAFDSDLATATYAQSIEQTFDSHYPGLTAIIVQLVEPFPPDNQPITLRLLELAPDPHERLSLTGPLSNFRVGGELRFAFDPLDDTAGRRYRLVIDTQAGRPLFLRAHSLNLYPAGELAGGGDLMFDIRYNGWLIPSLMALLPRLSENKPGVLGNPWLYVLLGVAYGAILVKVLSRVARPDRDYTADRQPDSLIKPENSG